MNYLENMYRCQEAILISKVLRGVLKRDAVEDDYKNLIFLKYSTCPEKTYLQWLGHTIGYIELMEQRFGPERGYCFGLEFIPLNHPRYISA